MAKINTLNYQTVASWNGSQDLFIVEQPDGTKVATPAMVKQYVLGNSIDDIYSVMGQNGAKNLLVPEWVETHTTENGVTYTFNADGTIIMNTDASGATANTNCNLRQNTVTTNNVFPAGTYTLTACPAGGSSTTYRTWARAYRPGTNTALTDNLYEEGNGVSFTVSEPFSLGINATVKSGYVCNNLTWKPMLRYASDTDDTYQPYAKTNRQLTEVIGDLSQTGLTGDSVAAQLGTVKGQIETANGQITSINNSLSPIDAIVKRFYINNSNTSLDTGINVNQAHTTGFAAVVSTFGTYNAGVASVYIGGVAHRKQDGTVGDLNYARLGGVGIGGSSDGANMQFSVVNDKLQLKTLQYQVGACVTLILSKRN